MYTKFDERQLNFNHVTPNAPSSAAVSKVSRPRPLGIFELPRWKHGTSVPQFLANGCQCWLMLADVGWCWLMLVLMFVGKTIKNILKTKTGETIAVVPRQSLNSIDSIPACGRYRTNHVAIRWQKLVPRPGRRSKQSSNASIEHATDMQMIRKYFRNSNKLLFCIKKWKTSGRRGSSVQSRLLSALHSTTHCKRIETFGTAFAGLWTADFNPWQVIFRLRQSAEDLVLG